MCVCFHPWKQNKYYTKYFLKKLLQWKKANGISTAVVVLGGDVWKMAPIQLYVLPLIWMPFTKKLKQSKNYYTV